jgi:flagellar basal body-associated protein FliL
MTEIAPQNGEPEQKSNRILLIIGVILLTVLLSVGITIWIVSHYVFPQQFDPVVLNQNENEQLNKKLDEFSWLESENTDNSTPERSELEPEKYSEEGATREIYLTERELNALLAKNTDMASKLAIDLSDNLASGKLLIPMDEDFPVLGGKNLKISAGMELAFSNSRPIIKLRGVSIMGIPLPNSWLGGLKNVDLINEFGQDEGFWKAFADGIKDIHIAEGNLIIKLKE